MVNNSSDENLYNIMMRKYYSCLDIVKKKKEKKAIGKDNKFGNQHFRHGKRIKGEILLKLMAKVF